jgi:hypothetical protein
MGARQDLGPEGGLAGGAGQIGIDEFHMLKYISIYQKYL